jgi:hypothetical protein
LTFAELLRTMTPTLDMSWHPWYDALSSDKPMIDNNSGILYQRNFKELVWYQEYIYQNGDLIGEIFTNIDGVGYNLKKATNVKNLHGQSIVVMETIAQFNTVADAKEFVNQAGGL